MRRFLRRALVLVVLLGLAAGMSGDVPSFAQRFDPDAELGAGVPATPTSAPPGTTPRVITSTTAPEPLEWTLYAGGDVLMDRSEPAGRNPFAHLVPPLAEADLAVVNVEMSVADAGAAQAGKEFTFQAPSSAATTISDAGIDVVSLGNNHSLDFGRDALLEGITHLRDNGVPAVGAGPTVEAAYAPAVIEVGGDGQRSVSVAIIAASAVVPGGWEVGAEPGLATTRGPALAQAVEAADAEHDVVIVFLHWGQENASCPSDDQITTGDSLVEAGADAVLGAHPHVLQPIVERGGALVAFSLGNFVWHSRTGPQGETGVLELRFLDAELDGFTFHPHTLDENGDPEPAGAEATTRIEAAVADHCGLALE